MNKLTDFLESKGYMIFNMRKKIGLWIDTETYQPIYDKVVFIETILIKNNKIEENDWRVHTNWKDKKVRTSYINLIVVNGEINNISFNDDGYYFYEDEDRFDLFINEYKGNYRNNIIKEILAGRIYE